MENKQETNKKQAESLYTKDELTTHAKKAFKVAPEVVQGALNGSKKREFTKSEAKIAIENFLKRKV